jgi:hypothetical protein
MPSSSSWRPWIALLAGIALVGNGCGGKEQPASVTPPAQPAGEPPAAVEPATYMGPEIRLDAPSRGAMLVEGGQEPVVVELSGEVCDSVHAVAELSSPSAVLSLATSGSCRGFQGQQVSRWGLNVVLGQATNDAGELGYLVQSFVRSASWFSNDLGDPAASAESGVLLQLDPSVVDDGDRSTLDDVASIAQAALASLDVDELVGSARVASPDANGDGHLDPTSHDCLFWTQHNRATGFEAWKSGPVTRGAITVDTLALGEGDLSVRVTVWNPSVPFAVTGNFDAGCVGDVQDSANGVARADSLSLAGRAVVNLDAQGRPRIAIAGVSTSLAGLHVDLSLGKLIDWTTLGKLVGEAIAAQVQGPIQDSIRQTVQSALDDQLSGILASLLELRASVTLPPELGGTELLVAAAIDHLSFTPERAVIGSAIQVRPAEVRPEHAAAAAQHGAMMMGGSRPDPTALPGSPAVLGVKDDVLNQFLHAAWLGGAFDVEDVSVVLGLPDAAGLKLGIHPTLPPLLMPRPADATAVDLGWGDIGFDATLSSSDASASAHVSGFASVVVALERLQVDPGGGTFSPVFAPDPEVHLQLTEVNWDRLPTTRTLATDMGESLLRGALPQLLAHAIRSFPLPRLTLTTIDPSLPSVILSLEDASIERVDRYQLVGGQVVARP